MALIKCPECGQQISSAAERCVHCGFTFTICPDCGEVLPSGTAICPNCGCNLQKNIKQSALVSAKSVAAQVELSVEAAADSVATAALNKVFAKQKKTFRIIKIISNGLYIVLFAIAMIVFISWCNKDILEKNHVV